MLLTLVNSISFIKTIVNTSYLYIDFVSLYILKG